VNDSSEIHERIAEFVKESKTAADRGEEALRLLDGGEPQKAYVLMTQAHRLDSKLDGILAAFAEDGIQPSL
jgi:hypothetical protein